MYSTKKILIMLCLITTTILTTLAISFAINNQTKVDEVNPVSIAPIDATLTSNRYTQIDDLTSVNENPYTKIDGHELIGVVNGLELYVNKQTLSIRVKSTENEYVWGSNMHHDYRLSDNPLYNPNDLGALAEGEELDLLNRFIRQDRSPVMISYYRKNSTNITRNNEHFFEVSSSGQIKFQSLTNGEVGFKASLVMPTTKIKFDVLVYLNNEGLNVRVPKESIEDSETAMLSTITLYKFFGFTKDTYTPGYAFIPDGVGALMRYENKTSPFIKKYYGNDITKEDLSGEKSLTAPVFGMVHGVNQHAMLGIIKSGAGNASLSYIPADNINSDFNRSQVTFEYRSTYIQKLNAQGTSTIERIQNEMNNFDIHLIYQFLYNDEANYVGFANKYRTYLSSNGINLVKSTENQNIPLHLDILATENKKVWYGTEVFTMTSTKQIAQIVNDLQKNNINNIDISIHGWQKGGASSTTPIANSIEPKFGKLTDLTQLQNVELFYRVTPLIATVNAGGYNASQIAQNQGSDLNTYGNNQYLLSVNSALEILKSNYSKLINKNISNLSLDEFGDLLYSDYKNKNISRSESILYLKEFLDVAQKSIISNPFDYLFGADKITEIEMYSSQQLKFSDTVPFLTILLSGHKDVYGRSHNFFANTSNELLRMVDYHVYPNFYVTHESAAKLQNTGSSYIFTSKYNDWQSEIIRQYNFVNDALKNVSSETFLSRVVLKPGLVKNTYSNQTIIYINYSGNTYVDNGITINALSYEVIK